MGPEVRILIVEDDPPSAAVLEHALKREQPAWRVAAASSIAALKEALEAGAPDLILCDYSLKGSTALEALELVRRLAPGTPLIVVTGSLDEETAAECIKAGAADYLIKGRLARLGSAVKGALERKQALEARKRAEDELRESRAFLEKAQEVGHVGSWISDLSMDGRLVWSKETHRIFGVEERAFDGTVASFFERIHPDDRASVRKASRDAVEKGVPYGLEHRIIRPDGTVRWVHEQADLQRGPDGRPAKMVGVVQDITERKERESQILLAQRTEAVARLAGGVAHEYNNLLTAILGYCQLIAAALPAKDPLRGDLEEIRRAGQRAAVLTKQLLAFSRRQIFQPQVFDLQEHLAGAAKTLGRMLGEDVVLNLALDPEAGRVKADPGQIGELLVHLALNARDAMPKGGTLTIGTSAATLDWSSARSHPDAKPGRYVVLSFADTGLGMPPEVLAHVFEPFFTTKGQGGRAGLGLATVYGIVRQSGGHVAVESAPGRGTTFRVYLPRAEEDAPAPRPVPAPAGAGSGTILVVEDEESVLGLAVRILKERGYSVLPARQAGEALDLCRAHAGTIQLLLTDVVMPGMSGPELAREVEALRPGIRILFMSGYTDSPLVREAAARDGTALLPKPFSPDELLHKVRERLGASNGR